MLFPRRVVSQDNGKYGGKRKHEELNDEFLAMLKVREALDVVTDGSLQEGLEIAS